MADGPGRISIATLYRDRTFSARPEFGLPVRLGSLAALFAAELVALSTWIDTSVLQGKPGLLGLIEYAGKSSVQAIVVFVALFLTFGYLRSKSALRKLSLELSTAPTHWALLGAHLAAMAALAGLTSILFTANLTGSRGNLVAATWMLTGVLGIVTGACALIPAASWFALLRTTGMAWAYAVGGSLAVFQVIGFCQRLWQPAIGLTFTLVRILLGFFTSDVIANPETATIGTRGFSANIGWGCSGVEGLGLILVFSAAWLWFFRRELRFPRAFLLIPAGVAILWTLNVVRITTLILIGTAGASAVAVGGFHSAAGWIAFNGVALGLSLAAQRLPWLTRRTQVEPATKAATENPTAAYLMPFLAILASAMIGRASSSTFEWLYPLRFFAAAAALWIFRDRYKNLNWNFGWLAPVIGTTVFVLWLALDRINGASANTSLGASLAALPSAGRLGWIVFRTLAAVVTVPIAEELAFRGFLMRRLISADFETVGLQVFRILAVVISSLAFGVLHGDRWIAAALAGAAYAGAQLWRGRIGDAVVAHGVTNAWIAAWVLTTGSWNLW